MAKVGFNTLLTIISTYYVTLIIRYEKFSFRIEIEYQMVQFKFSYIIWGWNYRFFKQKESIFFAELMRLTKKYRDKPSQQALDALQEEYQSICKTYFCTGEGILISKY